MHYFNQSMIFFDISMQANYNKITYLVFLFNLGFKKQLRQFEDSLSDDSDESDDDSDDSDDDSDESDDDSDESDDD